MAERSRPLAFQWSTAGCAFQHVDAAHHVIHLPEAHLRHHLAHLLCDEEKEIDDVFGLSREFLAQYWVLRGDSDRASVQMALAHHDAAHATNGAVANPNSSAPSNAAITTSRPVCSLPSACTRIRLRKSFINRHLLSFREPQFPWNSRMLDRTQGRRARPAAVTADEHNISMSFGNASSDRSDADFRD